VLESDTNVLDATDSTFALRNEPLSFFVNDADTTNDVFTTAPGASGNSGTSNSAPKDTISGILAVYDLEGGDTVYVDTGLYSTPQDTLVIWSRSGDATNQLTIRGSTNFAAGGTIINRGSLLAGNDGFEVKASYVTLRDMTVRGAYQGVYVDSNISVRVERMMLASNVYGVAITNASLPVVRNSGFLANEFRGVSIGSSVTSTVENCTFYANKLGAIGLVASLPNVLQNNIFSITTTGTAAYVGSLASTFVDYNVYDLVAPDAVIFSTNRALIPWQLGQGHDYRSAITNPLLANAEGGDFHLKSTIGRWVDGYGWTNDSEDSWAIDKGATNRSYALEPLPNGGRINMGAYGNTEYASLGRTSSTYLVEARILNTPTTIDATNATWPLVWTVINVPTNERFNVQFSGDNGGTWYNLATNVPAYTEVYIWQTSPFFNTYRGRWRVVGINDTNYWDINDAPVQVFYGQFRMTDISYDNYTNRMTWRGAWAEYYQVQYTTNIVSTNAMRWVNAPNGAGVHQQANFLSTNGGDFLYYDPESVTNKHRLYRVLWQQF
jgi:hypothetical protein